MTTQKTSARTSVANAVIAATSGIESAKNPRESMPAMIATSVVETVHAPPVVAANTSSVSPANMPKIAARRVSTAIAYQTTMTSTRLGATPRTVARCNSVVCARSAPTSRSAATHHRGPAKGASCALLFEYDNAIEGAEIDGWDNDGSLIEGRVVAFDRRDRADRFARRKDAPLARDDRIADLERRILRNIFDANAREVAARDAPPPAPLRDCGNLAGVIGDERDRAREWADGHDTSNDAARSEHAVVRCDAARQTVVDRHRTRFVLRRKPDDACHDTARIEVHDRAHGGVGGVSRDQFVQRCVLALEALVARAKRRVVVREPRDREEAAADGPHAADHRGDRRLRERGKRGRDRADRARAAAACGRDLDERESSRRDDHGDECEEFAFVAVGKDVRLQPLGNRALLRVRERKTQPPQRANEAGEREAHNGVKIAVDRLDECRRTALNPVGARFVERFTALDVALDLVVVEEVESHARRCRFFDECVARWQRERERGVYLMFAAREEMEHARCVGAV